MRPERLILHMNKVVGQLLLLLLICSFVQTGYGQNKRKIQIDYSGFMNTDEANYPGATILTRDDMRQVEIRHEGAVMYCDQAIHYLDQDFIEAYGNVRIIQGDTVNLQSKYVEYSGITKLAFASGDVVLRDPTSSIYTDTLYFDRTRQQSYYRTGGRVEKDTSGTITSTIGRYYMNLKKYQFVDNVKLTNESSVTESERLDYYPESGYAYLYGPSTITSENSVIYCERGFFDTESDTGYLVRNSRIDYDNRTVTGDSIYFDRTRSFASATNNIKIKDTVNNTIVKGHYAEVFRDKDSVFITKRALAITQQENDSIYIHGDTLMVTGDEDHRITRAFYNVKWYKSDLSGKADSIHVNHQNGLTKLINLNSNPGTGAFTKKRLPVLWNLGNQMTGDTIHLISNTETRNLDSLKVFYDAYVVSRDTLEAGYNQLKGRELIGLFRDNKIYEIEIIKNAESIYYLRNDSNELVGIDKAKSGRIQILVNDNVVEEVRKYNQVDGKTYPEEDFPEKERIMRGFNWREDERPRSIDDLFSDDPPLVLPVIKGLSDYIPQEEFFNDALMERVESARPVTPGVQNRASQQIPKSVIEKRKLERKPKANLSKSKPLKKDND